MIFCSCCKFTTKMIAVTCVSMIFIISAVVYMFIDMMGWIDWKPYGLTYEDDRSPIRINSMSELINIMMLTPLILTIVYFYTCMRNTLGKCTSQKFAPEKKRLNLYFIYLLIAYILRLLYIVGLDNYSSLIC